MDYSEFSNLELARHLLGEDYETQLYRGMLAPYFVSPKALARGRERLEAASELVKRRLKRGYQLPAPLSSSVLINEYLRAVFAHQEHESFTALILDQDHQLVRVDELLRRPLDETLATARAIVQHIIDVNAVVVIFHHRLPLGTVEPTAADLWLADYLTKVLSVLKVEIVDYVVLAGNEPISLAKRGWR